MPVKLMMLVYRPVCIVENAQFKMFFHIEKNNTITSTKLYVDSIFTSDEEVFIPANATKKGYQEFIKKEFPRFPYSLNFIESLLIKWLLLILE